MQPPVQKIADKSPEGDSTDEGEGELETKYGLLNELRRFLAGFVRNGIVAVIAQNYCPKA